MRFGPVARDDAEGAILAHSVRHAGGVLKKGTRLDQAAISALREAGIAEVVAAVLEPDDVHEDEAALRLARATAGEAAGGIHSDLERGFVRAEAMSCDDLFRLGSEREIKANGLMRREVRDYVVQEGDILHILAST